VPARPQSGGERDERLDIASRAHRQHKCPHRRLTPIKI
jgi:hypothetical protein